MARIGGGGNEPKGPRVLWPWGGPRSIREKLVDPLQFERKRRKKLGDPRRPALPSTELIEFMGPGHASDELRLPPPPSPYGDADPSEVTYFPDREFTRTAVNRGASGALKRAFEVAFSRMSVPPDKLERMRAIIQREAQMIVLVSRVQDQVTEIIERMKVEYKANGSY